MKTIYCEVCGESFQSLGFARHRAKHYDDRKKFYKQILNGHIGNSTIKKEWKRLFLPEPIPESKKEQLDLLNRYA